MIQAAFDAIWECIEIIPFLLLIFYIIEFVEYFYSDKLLSFNFKKSARFAPLIGAVLASIPQCGLSVVASTLYVKRFITRGTLIAVYLATSDEAIPVLLANPEGARVLLPLIVIKILTGLFAGYLIDIFWPSYTAAIQNNDIVKVDFEKGCHSHSVAKESIRELLLHPVIHTLSVAFFIFLVTFAINLIWSNGVFGYFADSLNHTAAFIKPVLEPIIAAIFGIIPNCAVSVGIAIMYLKGAISFSSCVSGLCAGAGLGILVLIRKNADKKDTFKIILLLLVISILAGFIVEILSFFLT